MPGVEQLLLFCWTGIVKKFPANSYISTHIFVQISDLSWEVSLCSRGGLTWTDTDDWSQFREVSVESSMTNGTCFYHTSSARLREYGRKGWKMVRAKGQGWWEWNGVFWICQDHWTQKRSSSVACARPRRATLQHGARSGPWASTTRLGTGDSGRFGEERGSLL